MEKTQLGKPRTKNMVNIFIVGSYEFTAKTLDKKRKLKQAIELKQIIDTIKRVNKVKELKEKMMLKLRNQI